MPIRIVLLVGIFCNFEFFVTVLKIFKKIFLMFKISFCFQFLSIIHEIFYKHISFESDFSNLYQIISLNIRKCRILRGIDELKEVCYPISASTELQSRLL